MSETNAWELPFLEFTGLQSEGQKASFADSGDKEVFTEAPELSASIHGCKSSQEAAENHSSVCRGPGRGVVKSHLACDRENHSK